MRYQGTVHPDNAIPYGDAAAMCDVEPFDLFEDDPIPRENYRIYAHDNVGRSQRAGYSVG